MDTSVLIVGAGPVGLTLAHKLATYGCPIRIIDKNQAPTDLSKALVVWQRTLEVLDSTVDIQQFLEHSDASSVHGMIFQTPEETLGQVELDGSEGPLPTGVFIPQSATEHLLVEKLAQQGIHVERETELVSFTQDDHGVVSQIRGPQGDTTSVTSSWIVGADGAHSKVRHGLDLPFEGDTIERRWLLADITVEKEQDPHFMHAYLGADAMLECKVGSETLLCRASGQTQLAVGTNINLTFDTSDLHVFESASGRRTNSILPEIEMAMSSQTTSSELAKQTQT